MKNSSDTIGNRTLDLPTCSAALNKPVYFCFSVTRLHVSMSEIVRRSKSYYRVLAKCIIAVLMAWLCLGELQESMFVDIPVDSRQPEPVDKRIKIVTVLSVTAGAKGDKLTSEVTTN